MGKISVFVASDFVLLQEGLRALLVQPGSEVEIVGAGEVQSISTRVKELHPAVLLLTIWQDEPGIFDLVKSVAPLTRIIAVSTLRDPEFVLRLLRAGVRGFISSQEPSAELVRSLHSVARDEVFLCPSASKALVAEYRVQSQMH